MPTLTADTDAASGSPLRRLRARSQPMASASATYPPVTAAVRVPPSACSTSQSMMIVFSPSAFGSTQARSDRPTSREISWVRPPGRPLTDSRSLRVLVARGSIAYSPVTQPSPLPRRHRGTSSVTLAAHSTRVAPNSTSTEPSAWSSQPRVNLTSRSSSGERPSGLGMPASLAEVEDLAGGDHGYRPGERAGCLGQAPLAVIPRDQVSQQQPSGPGPFGMLAGLAAAEVNPGRQAGPVAEGRLAEQQVGVPGQRLQGR